jgi:hypothetical protein
MAVLTSILISPALLRIVLERNRRQIEAQIVTAKTETESNENINFPVS